MKTCKDCGQAKSYDQFVAKASCKDGYEPRCRRCRSIRYNKSTIDLFFKKIYNSQCTNSINRGHPLPDYTVIDLMYWADQQARLSIMWDDYVNSGYDQNLAPSVDRIDDLKPYTLNNLQLMTWAENRAKGAQGKRLGTVNANQRRVMSLFLDGMPDKTYHSIMDAARSVKGHMSGISGVANGVPIRKSDGTSYTPRTYKGRLWKWV